MLESIIEIAVPAAMSAIIALWLWVKRKRKRKIKAQQTQAPAEQTQADPQAGDLSAQAYGAGRVTHVSGYVAE